MLGNFEGQPEPKPVKIINELIEEKLIIVGSFEGEQPRKPVKIINELIEEKLIKDGLLPDPQDSGRSMVDGLLDLATDYETAREPIEPKERDFLSGLDFRAEDPTRN